ncbi:oxygenase MpaB family protein [Natronococcus wangiae]|uniref:oxygenase MpaB family protein n=1 Tax=Natronococcus wangiae TaxID=3068275 RepID=UPI0027400803|nr:oxygenase MpaB family protein [Natronococcus sp. AD5]
MDQSNSKSASVPAADSLPPDIAALVAESETPQAGFFGPGSAMWTISRERVLLASGVSTVLLQVAHPLVAAGVAEHSDFEASPSNRFRSTFDLVHAVIFGDVKTAVKAALEIRTRHERITGILDSAVGPFSAKTRYAASDPDLLLWVHATLIEQALTAFETYIAPLPATTQAAYYQECKVFGQLLGIPTEQYPETLAGFFEYYDRMLETELAVGAHGRDLYRTLASQWRAFEPLYTILAAGTLPDPVRDEFRLLWTPRRQRAFDAGATFSRAVVPSLPSRLRYVAAYRHARARV